MREIKFHDEARAGLKKGVDLISNAVKATLGPRGRNVVFGYHYGYPVATKDGVTVARQVESKDQLEQIGVLLVREVAQKTADDSGDGTTTASVLTQAIFNKGLKALSSGVNPILIKKGIDNAVELAINLITIDSKNIREKNEISDVAKISANNDSLIGDLVVEAITAVGNNGVITIEDNYSSSESFVQVVEGMQLNEGMISPFFMTNTEKLLAEYDNPKILLIDGELNDIMPIQSIIKDTIMNQKKPLVIIAHNVIGTALQTLTMSKAQNGAPLLACKASQFGEYRADLMSDVAILTGATVMGGTIGIPAKDFLPKHLGNCSKIVADRFSTTITGGKGDKEEINNRINIIDTLINKSESDYEKEKLQERIAKLTTGVAVIKVGGITEIEQKEKKARVEDSLNATKAAIESGIVAGGGITYLKVSNILFDTACKNDEERIGFQIVKDALLEPLKQIASNSGVSGDEIIAHIKNSVGFKNYGYNFLTNEYEDLIEGGVVDPAKVVINALKNAGSVASMLLTTEVVIYESEEDVVPAARTPKPISQ